MDIRGVPAIAEVEFFFQLRFGDTVHTLALVSVFSPPDQEILESSNHAAYICHHGGTDSLTIVDVKSITSVVSMVPDFQVTGNGDIIVPDNAFCLVEVSFTKLSGLRSVTELEDVIENDANDFVE